jgi:hypothetical protein
MIGLGASPKPSEAVDASLATGRNRLQIQNHDPQKPGKKVSQAVGQRHIRNPSEASHSVQYVEIECVELGREQLQLLAVAFL